MRERAAVHETEVDGVRTVWAEVPGPLRAGLTVRVGWADETLVTSGITRLLELLTRLAIGHPSGHSNSRVDQTALHFHCTGDDATVSDFVGSVSRHLADPPTARLAEGLGAVRTELAGRRSTIEDTLLAWRYGATTFGLNGQSQYVVDRVDADQVAAWSRGHATRGNTALWLSGPPPAGLRLHLPEGAPTPVPDPRRTIQPQLPVWFSAPDSSGVALHALVPRDRSSRALAQVLRDRLTDRLRGQGAMAHPPRTDHRVVSRDLARLLAVSHLVDDRRQDAVGVFLSALTDLVEGAPVTDAELAAWHRAEVRNATEPSMLVGLVAARAWDLLVGHTDDPVEHAVAAGRQVTAEGVAASARLAAATAVAAIPDGVAPPDGTWGRAAPTTDEPLSGVEVRGLDPSRAEVMVVSPEGLTWRCGGEHLTVVRDRVAAVLHWQDGRRVVIGEDANRIVVEPTMWLGGRSVVNHVDAVFAADLRVEQPERSPRHIPQPPRTAAPVPPPSSAQRLWSIWWPRWKVLLMVLLAVGIAVAVVLTRRPGLLFWPLAVLAFRYWANRDAE